MRLLSAALVSASVGAAVLSGVDAGAVTAKRTVLVSVNSEGAVATGGHPALSSDGRYVAFSSPTGGSNLDARCRRAGAGAIFLRDRVAGTTECVSLDDTGTQPLTNTFSPHVSDDGRYVQYWAEPVDPLNSAAGGVFVRDRLRGLTLRANVDTSGAVISSGCFPSAMSTDGSTVAFSAGFALHIRDLARGTTTTLTNAVSSCENTPALNRTGQSVAFIGRADNGVTGLVLHDRTTAARRLVRPGAAHPSLSADGSVVAYDTRNAADRGDTNGQQDVYVLDRTTRTTTRVSVSTAGALSNGASYRPRLSPNGQFVGFLSKATNLVPADTNGWDDVFVRDRVTGITFRTNLTATGAQASRGMSTAGGEQIGITTDAANQTLVAFTSSAPLVSADRDLTDDIYLRTP